MAGQNRLVALSFARKKLKKKSSIMSLNQHSADSPLVVIIVLNWNGKNDTLECLESLETTDYLNYRIIAVDNGSTDGSVTAIRARFPQITVLETGANLGFAEGNNAGIRHALNQRADYVFLLNNDTVVDRGLISTLVEAAEAYPAGGVFGPKIYYHAEPSRIWYAGGVWNEEKKYFEQRGDGETDLGQYETPGSTEFIIGCAMFIPAKIFEKIGMLEPRFFLNYEEIDFCTRIKAAGLENIYVPRAKLWHKVSASFGGEDSPLKIYFTFRNRLLWAERNLPWRRAIGIHLSIYGGFKRRFMTPISHGMAGQPFLKGSLWALASAFRNPGNQAWLKGIRDYWLRRFGNCPKDVWRLQQRWKAAKAERVTE